MQYCATTYISHNYHSNHKILCFKKIVHTVKPLPGQFFIDHLELKLNASVHPYSICTDIFKHEIGIKIYIIIHSEMHNAIKVDLSQHPKSL